MAIYKNTPPIITSGLTLYLDAANSKSYITGSTVWNDLSGIRNSGSLVGGPGFSTDGGGSITFPGSQTVSVSNFPIQISGTGSKTISCFFKTSVTTRAGLIGTRNGASNGWAMYVNNPAGDLTYYHAGTGRGDHGVAAGIAINRWYNAAATFDLPTNTSILYLNGVRISTSLMGGTPMGSNGLSGSIGIEEVGTSTFFTGRIATTLIYDRVLSAAEVQQNYNALKTRFGLT